LAGCNRRKDGAGDIDGRDPARAVAERAVTSADGSVQQNADVVDFSRQTVYVCRTTSVRLRVIDAAPVKHRPLRRLCINQSINFISDKQAVWFE